MAPNRSYKLTTTRKRPANESRLVVSRRPDCCLHEPPATIRLTDTDGMLPLPVPELLKQKSLGRDSAGDKDGMNGR